jgi:hypothetical protein
MKIIEPPKPWPEGSSLVLYGSDQNYITMPAIRRNDQFGVVTSCWRLSVFERCKVLLTGRIYVSLMTFGKPIQPQKLTTSMEMERVK